MLNETITRMKEIYAKVDEDVTLMGTFAARDGVSSRYGAIFSLKALPNLTATDFRSFLRNENNRHFGNMMALHGPQTCKDGGEGRRVLLLPSERRRQSSTRLRQLRRTSRARAIATRNRSRSRVSSRDRRAAAGSIWTRGRRAPRFGSTAAVCCVAEARIPCSEASICRLGRAGRRIH